ncbi:lactonase family protein [Methylomonas sp. 11b]|uniref:6-phosphogluconolactonase (Cycloisomerase 2 family) n=2 Tax=Methylomonas methanica TaxID=421 RepID=A0A177MQH2_METMH|nr:beta-propeller fold lactonase family protein [Methylomonas sp. 11b]OAI08057.1 hypothetical protein A1332_08295 [Methylomonas methanica]PPD23520.1 MAG: hypothetical protein CTY24_04095 [Methylobacter sp.]
MKKEILFNRSLWILSVLIYSSVFSILYADENSGKNTTIYTLTNDPVVNGNAVAAYRQNADGSLAPLPGSPFLTGGMGWKTKFVLPHFGPFDLDQAITLSPDKKRLFAVNGGSDTVAVFDVSDDGSLKPVPGSPFPSGGKNPVSIGYAGDYLVVVNKNEDPGRDMAASKPNYSVHKITENGALMPVPEGKVELATASRSPTQALIVNNRFVYDGDFGSFYLPAREAMWGKLLNKQKPSTIRVLQLSEDGKLSLLQELEAPQGIFDGGLDTNKDGKPDPLMFGLQSHPKEPLIYVSMVTGAKLGVFEYDDSGTLKFVDSASNSGELICWVAINKAGTRAYTTNNGSDTVSVYDLSDPRHPKEIQHMDLRGYGAPYQLALSPDEKYLYTVKHRTFDKTPVGDGGTLNVVEIGAEGRITENKYSPYNIPNRGDLLARPLGIATR